MSYFDYYDYPEYSELDELVDETVDKVKQLIINNSKDKVNNILNSAKEYKAMYQQSQEQIRKQNKTILDLHEQIDELKKKKQSLNELPFDIGEEFYYPKYSSKLLNCPTCNGTGKVKTETKDYGVVEVICPTCKGNFSFYCTPKPLAKVDYNYAEPNIDIIDNITIKGDKHIILYTGKYAINRKDIFKTKEECQKYCDELNKKFLKEAQDKLAGREVD